MKNTIKVASGSMLSLVLATSMVGQAYACHPEGHIVKSVEDITVNTSMKEADDETGALRVHSGDVLKYTITVSNTAAAGDNDMTKTVVIDTLPDGVELTGDPSQRTVSIDMGTIKPGDSVTKTYQAKVTGDTDDQLIENEACFTANNRLNNLPQKGCDKADVKVTVPASTETPAPTPSPTPAPTAATLGNGGADTPAAQPEELPNTGIASTLVGIAGLTAAAAGYALSVLRLKRNA